MAVEGTKGRVSVEPSKRKKGEENASSLVMNGSEVQRSVNSVDVGDELLGRKRRRRSAQFAEFRQEPKTHLRNRPLQLRALAESRLSDLDQYDLSSPLGVGLQQPLESFEL